MPDIELPDDDHLKLLLAASWASGIHDLLFRDTRLCLEEWKTHKERAAEGALLFEDGELDRFQFWFRSLVRSFAAQVEGTCYYLRKTAAEAYDRGQLPSLPAELRPKLLEEDPENPGKKKYNRFLENMELGFKWFAVAFGKTFTLPKGDHRWTHFRALVGFRNQITHPKSLEDFSTTGDQIIPVEQGMLWFAEAFKDLTVTCGIYRSPEELARKAAKRRAALPQPTQEVWNQLEAVQAANKEAWRSRDDPTGRKEAEQAIYKAMQKLTETAGVEVPPLPSEPGEDEPD